MEISDESRGFRAILSEMIQGMLSWRCNSGDLSSTQRVNSAIQASHWLFNSDSSEMAYLFLLQDKLKVSPCELGHGSGILSINPSIYIISVELDIEYIKLFRVAVILLLYISIVTIC